MIGKNGKKPFSHILSFRSDALTEKSIKFVGFFHFYLQIVRKYGDMGGKTNRDASAPDRTGIKEAFGIGNNINNF